MKMRQAKHSCNFLVFNELREDPRCKLQIGIVFAASLKGLGTGVTRQIELGALALSTLQIGY